MKVKNEVHIYKIDDNETKVGDKVSLIVSNVWNYNNLVELQIGEDGKKVTVHEADLRKAINNATGNERF